MRCRQLCWSRAQPHLANVIQAVRIALAARTRPCSRGQPRVWLGLDQESADGNLSAVNAEQAALI